MKEVCILDNIEALRDILRDIPAPSFSAARGCPRNLAPRTSAARTAYTAGGTSLAVYPAAGLIDYFQGRHLVLINKTEMKADARAEMVIREAIGKTLEAAVAALNVEK